MTEERKGKELLQLLAEELAEWPEGATHAIVGITGRDTGMLVGFSKGEPAKDQSDGGWTTDRGGHSLNDADWIVTDDATWLTEEPTDWETAIVSRKEWEEERQALINAQELLTGSGNANDQPRGRIEFVHDSFDDPTPWPKAEPPGVQAAGRRVNELRDAIRTLCNDKGNAQLYLDGEIGIEELAAAERWNASHDG